MSANLEIDIRHILPSIRVPTLVMHARRDRIIPVECGMYLAEHVPGARFIELDSDDHLPWGVNGEAITSHVLEFLTGARPGAEIDTVVGTILFSDIVDSTRLALERGDRRWADLLEAHHAAIRTELSNFRGREINTTGDGLVAMFDGPARALRCGHAIQRATSSLGLAVRVGVHTGECAMRDGQVSGVALHIAARIAALAPPSQVLASRTVKDLVAGSGLAFQDFGSHRLKGIPEEWHLFTVASPTH